MLMIFTAFEKNIIEDKPIRNRYINQNPLKITNTSKGQ